MIARTWPLVVAALLVITPGAKAAPEKRLDDQIKQMADVLRKTLTEGTLQGRTVQVKGFTSPSLEGTNFGPKIKRQLAEALKDLIAANAALSIIGEYMFVESNSDTAADDTNFKLKVLRVNIQIRDTQQKVLDEKSFEVNDTDDIAAALGLTVQPPFNGGQKARNEAGEKAFQAPKFFVRDRTRISDAADSLYSVEVRVKSTPDGAGRAVAPQDQKGHAFVDIAPTQFYELQLYNDEPIEAAATITIDGLDALNTFNTDPVKYRSYIIPAKGSVLVRGWMHTTKPGAKDNVLSFLVTEYGHGAATRFKNTGEVGVITVQFAMAWEGDRVPTGGKRGGGRETTEGPGLPEKLEVVKRHIGNPRSTISVRYSPGN